MKTSQQTTYTFELSHAELQEAIATYVKKRTGIEITINPNKLSFSGTDICDGVLGLLLVEYKA